MMDPETDVDAIGMKRRAARRIHERLADKNDDKRRAYWQNRTENLR